MTHRKPRTWKPRQMRIWDRTEKRRAPEMRPEGGRWATSSFHAGFRLTAGRGEGGRGAVREICPHTARRNHTKDSKSLWTDTN